MSRRRYRRSSDAGGAISGLLIAGMACAWIFWPAFTGLAFPWQIAVAVLTFSILLLFVLFLVDLFRAIHRRNLLRRELLALKPAEFEERVLLLLKDLGWTNLRLRGGSGDRGSIWRASFRDNVTLFSASGIVNQCRRQWCVIWQGRSIFSAPIAHYWSPPVPLRRKAMKRSAICPLNYGTATFWRVRSGSQ